MAQAAFVHEGAAIDYTPTALMSPLETSSCRVTWSAWPVSTSKQNVLGALAVTGVFDFAKAPALPTGIGRRQKSCTGTSPTLVDHRQ